MKLLVVTALLALSMANAQGIRGVSKVRRKLQKESGNCITITRGADGVITKSGLGCSQSSSRRPDAKSDGVGDKGVGGKNTEKVDFVINSGQGDKDEKGFEEDELVNGVEDDKGAKEDEGEDENGIDDSSLAINEMENDKDDKNEDGKDGDEDEFLANDPKDNETDKGDELAEEDFEDEKDDKGEDSKDADLMLNELKEDEDETSEAAFALPDIVEIAVETSSLSSLYRLVAAAGLAPTLRGPGPFTLFAPIDTAFPAGANLLQLQADPTLPTTLAYHVVPGLIRSTDLSNGEMLTTLHGDNVTAYLYPTTGIAMIDHAKIIYTDVEASNGIVHFIDRVLKPSAVCSALQVAEFECAIMDDVVGLLVCRDGTTTCSLASEFLAGDICGCCLGDTSRDCKNKKPHGVSWEDDVELAPSPPTAPSAGGICSAKEVSELACDVVQDVAGVVVCRGGVTACTLTVQTQEKDICGCCPGDNVPFCVDDNNSGGLLGGDKDIDFEVERCFGC